MLIWVTSYTPKYFVSVSIDDSFNVCSGTSCIVYFCRDCNGRTPLIMAAACDHVGVIGSLLQVNAEPYLTDNSQYSALHWCCYNGRSTELFVVLILSLLKHALFAFLGSSKVFTLGQLFVLVKFTEIQGICI